MVRVLVLSVALATVMCGGCSSAPSGVGENLGLPRREQLVARVAEARDEFQRTRQQFTSAQSDILSATNRGGRDFDGTYDKLKKEYDRCVTRAEAVRGRVKDVERVADGLFKEWTSELTQYSNSSLQQASQRELDSTLTKYTEMLGTMYAVESRTQTVLASFQDHVLLVKHNLNTTAIASARDQRVKLQSDVATMSRELEASIAEANSFITQLRKPDGK